MSVFEWYAVGIIGWEGTALLTGRTRWPPTISETVRRAEGWYQAVVAVALLLPAFAHLVEWIA